MRKAEITATSFEKYRRERIQTSGIVKTPGMSDKPTNPHEILPVDSVITLRIAM